MIETIKIAMGLLSPRHRKLFFMLALIMLANALMETASLGILFPVIFSLLDPDAVNSIPVVNEFLGTYSPVRGRNFILIALGLACVGYILKNALSAFFMWIRVSYVEAVAAGISNRMFKKYLGEEFEQHLSRDTNTIVRNLTQIILTFKGNFLSTFLDFLTQATIGIGIFIFLLFVDATLVLYFAIVMGLLMLLGLKKIRTISSQYGKQYTEELERYNQVVISSFHAYKEIQVLKRKSFFLAFNNRVVEKLKRIYVGYAFISQLPRLLIEAVIVVLAISAMGILFSQNDGPEFIIAKLGIFAFASLKLLPMLNSISGAFSNISYARESIEIINDILNKNNGGDANPEAEESVNIAFEKSIALKNLQYHYTNEKGEPVPVLKGIDLTIKKNTSIGLVGSSGSGKTTLVDIIIGLLHPHEGEILIDGKSLQQEGVRGVWTNRIGYIPQQIALGNLSVKENVALGIAPEHINMEQVSKALEIAQLKNFVDGLPRGVDTKIGDAGIKLSGGQRQRIGIARALYHEPEILVLDEATSALDNETEQDFVTSLSRLNKNTTQIIIAHRLSTVKNCDYIYVLQHGKVVGEGTYRALEKSSTHFRKMLLKKPSKARVKK